LDSLALRTEEDEPGQGLRFAKRSKEDETWNWKFETMKVKHTETWNFERKRKRRSYVGNLKAEIYFLKKEEKNEGWDTFQSVLQAYYSC